MLCPRDHRELLSRQIECGTVSWCGSCRGLWLDRRTFEKAVASRGGRPPQLNPARASAKQPAVCPADGSLLAPVLHQEVEVNVCTSCLGLWLDADALDKILARTGKGDSAVYVSDTSDDPLMGFLVADWFCDNGPCD